MSFSNITRYYISSVNKISGTTDDFYYIIPIDVLIQPLLTHCSVIAANIPKSYYGIRTGHNKFQFTEGNFITDITIPEGNYSDTQFYNKISLLLTNVSPALFTYTCTAEFSDHSTGKLKIVCSNGNVIKALLFPDNSDVAVCFGCVIGVDYPFTGTFISPYVINLNQQSQTIYLNSDLCLNDYYDSNNDSSAVLCSFYGQQWRPFGYITNVFQSLDLNMVKLSLNKNFKFHFWFTDDSGNPYDFHNIDVTFTIALFTFTPLKDLYDITLNYVKLKLTNTDEEKRKEEYEIRGAL